jgi:dTDP-4-dehydrorhamnose reductase
MRQLADGHEPDHPVLAGPGWWKRPERFFCAPVAVPGLFTDLPVQENHMAPILISGASGTLGRAFARVCRDRGLKYRLVSRDEMDIAVPAAIEKTIAECEPWAIVNAAGYVRVDEAETDVERCFRENTVGPTRLASICERDGIALVTFSSDLVFDGAQHEPYIETDRIAPLNVYGRSKAEAEKRVLDSHPDSLVIRTSAFFGPWDEYNYITVALRELREKRPFLAAKDLTVSPTYVPDLVNTCLDLLIDREKGIWHLCNRAEITWAELAIRAAQLANVDLSLLQPCQSEELKFVARRPLYSALGSSRSASMPSLDDALTRYLSQCEAAPVASGRE